MPDITHLQNLERCIFSGTLKLEDLSPDDKKELEIYRKERQNESNKRLESLENEKFQRFLNSTAKYLPKGSKNIKLLGENWFSFEFEENRYMTYYYFMPNSSTPIFTCMTKIS
jgi:hypothetical protein